jgi:hypothetical protein
MSKNPEFDYTEFALKGFKKTFPTLFEADPNAVARWVYETVSAFSGRDGRSLAGGGEDDIRCLVAAAAAVELNVCAARAIKDALRARLRRAWLENDHATILSVARGFERAAAMAVVDLRDVSWADPYRVLEEDEEDEEEAIEIPEAVGEWAEVLCEPSDARAVIGNQSRSRERRKPVERAAKSLFEEGVA